MIILLILAALINFIAVFSPELGFDALWYHLTIPKIYLMWGKIDFIPGGLLYYSALPRLGEFLYLLVGANDTLAHFINWLFGLGTALIIYKISKSWLAALIFYAAPLIGWQSGSAYIDLIRTFFEALALYLVLSSKPVLAGLSLGLAIGTKTLALGSLIIFGLLKKTKLVVVAIVVSAPWFLWSYLKTGYPFYPLGAGILDARHNLGNIWPLVPLDPFLLIYLLTFPWWPRQTLIFKYAVLAFLVWFITPRTGETRFLLPYLPAFAILAAMAIQKKKILIIPVLFWVIFSIFYRGVANIRLFPNMHGQETKEQFLCRRLDFKTSVFVDCDGWFAKNIKPTDLILASNVHNLYYLNFPFVHESWYQGEKYNYILTYNQELDKKLIYQNNLTGMRLYRP